jgi:uncharacterized protein with PIN domain
MIVVDSSVFIAILEQEPEAERFLFVIRDATRRLASAVSVYETGIVIGARRGRQSAEEIMAFLSELGVEIVPFAEPYISQALDAYSRFVFSSMFDAARRAACTPYAATGSATFADDPRSLAFRYRVTGRSTA